MKQKLKMKTIVKYNLIKPAKMQVMIVFQILKNVYLNITKRTINILAKK